MVATFNRLVDDLGEGKTTRRAETASARYYCPKRRHTRSTVCSLQLRLLMSKERGGRSERGEAARAHTHAHTTKPRKFQISKISSNFSQWRPGEDTERARTHTQQRHSRARGTQRTSNSRQGTHKCTHNARRRVHYYCKIQLLRRHEMKCKQQLTSPRPRPAHARGERVLLCGLDPRHRAFDVSFGVLAQHAAHVGHH